MKKHAILLILLLSSVMLWAQKPSVKVFNINQAGSLPEHGIIYSLPMNKIKIHVTAIKKVIKAGPFKDYAQKYLGEANVVKADKVAWEINKIDLFPTAHIDTSQIYVVSTTGDNFANYISITDEGFLKAINLRESAEEIKQRSVSATNPALKSQNKSLSYSQLSTTQTLVEKVDTVYKRVQQDTMVVRVPIVRRQLVQKSREQKAAEIAKLLFTLRDDKNALLIGEGDGNALPDGAALKQMLAEMDRLENEYMAMFIGKSWQEVYHFEYEYTPNQMRSFERKVLFKLSSQFGILPADDSKGVPILLAVKKDNSLAGIRYFLEKQERMRKKPLGQIGIAYRIPGLAQITIQKNKEPIFSKSMKIAQYGYINHLPATLLKKKNYSVQFNSLYGSLIGIHAFDNK